jgi:hypothetical protein
MAKPSLSTALQGARVLIVEDAILAMDMEDRLKTEGCRRMARSLSLSAPTSSAM